MRSFLLALLALCTMVDIRAQEKIGKPDSNSIEGAGDAIVSNSFGVKNGHIDEDLYLFFRNLLDSCYQDGLDKGRYFYNEIFEAGFPKNTDKKWAGLYFNAALNYCRDISRGPGIKGLGYNGLKEPPGDSLEFKLKQIYTKAGFELLLESIRPSNGILRVIQEALGSRAPQHHAHSKQLIQTLNTLRWISHFHLDRYIVVNIPSGSLHYFQNGALVLSMKVVTGKPSTQTPRFAAYCNEIILYPYWHVPRSIAVNELLPLAKRRPGILSAMNLDVIDSRGQVISSGKINWHKYSKYNFPYQFRQSTGCGNALGVIKFNLTSPYSVYLHDTNMKNAFTSNERYFSHGCIRIEKPIELANYLLPGKIDSNFLKACIRNQRPVNYALQRPVPIFVTYLRAWVDTANSVKYYRDIYHLKDAE